jgi:hypothetical protein
MLLHKLARLLNFIGLLFLYITFLGSSARLRAKLNCKMHKMALFIYKHLCFFLRTTSMWAIENQSKPQLAVYVSNRNVILKTKAI